MVKNSDTDCPTPDGHPSGDALLLYVDGELATKEAGNVRAHLEACWSCRVRTEKVQEAISSFIDYRNTVLKPLIEQPPHGWRGFDGKLGRLAAESGKRSPFSIVFGSLGRFFSVKHLFVMPRHMARAAAGLLIAVIIAALVIRFKQEPTVSASELLRHATAAHVTQIRATTQPVVYQKLQVRRKDQASSREETINLEIWNDTANSRFRQSLVDMSTRQFLPVTNDSETIKIDHREGASVPVVLAELEQVLQANQMDPKRPLSSVAYQAWRNSLSQKNEEVTRTQLSGGIQALTLRTVPTGQVAVGQITEAMLVVRAEDWHPVEQRLHVRGDGGDRVYELTETAFEIVTLTALSPEIFAESKPVASLPTPSVIPPSTPTPLLSANNLQPIPLMITPVVRPVATADLEVEVLRLLNQAGADLGEQVITTRTGDGILQVTGIVETDQRKSEIIHALQPIMNNPAVHVEIKTVAEAVAQQQGRQTGAVPPPAATKQKVEIASDAIAAEGELLTYFAREGGRADEAARQYAARMVGQSRRAMSHVYALKRLRGQFTPEQLRLLSPEARSKLRALIRSHARAYQSESETLRRELQPIFFPAAPGAEAHGDPVIADMAGLFRAIEQLFESASANDHVIRSAFAASTEGATTTAIRTPQFWQSLRSAESLAARIQSAK